MVKHTTHFRTSRNLRTLGVNILKKPHPFIFNIYSVLIPCIITCLILNVLPPLEFQELSVGRRLFASVVIAFFVALSIIIVIFSLKKLFPFKKLEDQWTIGKEILLIFSIVLIIIFFISASIFFIQIDYISPVPLILKTASITLATSIFPVFILVLFEQNRHQIKQVQKAIALNKSLEMENTELRSIISNSPVQEEKLLIKAENNTIELQLNSMDILFIKSDGNYVEVFFFNEEQLQKKLIRNRLKAIENQLPGKIFFRCHNSFIVNGHHIIRFEGNARSLELQLKGYPDTIPVSRSKANTIEPFLAELSTIPNITNTSH